MGNLILVQLMERGCYDRLTQSKQVHVHLARFFRPTLATDLLALALHASSDQHLSFVSLTPASLTKNPGQTDEQHDTPDVQHASHLWKRKTVLQSWLSLLCELYKSWSWSKLNVHNFDIIKIKSS